MTCTKVVYPSKREALAALDAARSKGEHDPRRHETRAYRCDDCPAWHLTSQPVRRTAPRPESRAS